MILSLLEKHPARRPASANLVALALFEEAERARRLERINPGLKRSDPRSPVGPPPSRTMTVGDRKAELTPPNGTGRVDPGPLVMSATEPPPSALPRHSGDHGVSAVRSRRPLESSGTGRKTASGSDSHPVAREMLETILATPIVLSPEERYLCGHYLAYLLGGSRRRGIFLRRPLDARNADRARLLLAMTWLSCVEPTDEAIERASVTARGPPRRPRRAQPRRGDQVPGQPGYVRQAQAIPRGPQAAPGCQRLRAQGDARRQGRAQPRPDAPDPRRPGDDRPAPRRARRPPRVPLEPRRGSLAPGGRLPPGGPPLRHAIRPPRRGQRRPLARGRLPADRACPLAAHVSTPARGGLGLRGRQAAPRPRARASGSTG